MKRIIKNIIPAAFIALTLGGLTSCVGDLDVDNINPQQVSTPDNDAVLNKIYSNLVLTGQKGPDGNGDIDGIDEGTSSFGWEMRRRMDLIRFGKFAGQSSYKWQWESGSEDGQAFDSHCNVYAIPATDRNANENLKQNPGY